MDKIITDGKLLSKELTATAKLYASAHKRLHVGAISAIWHLAKHGNPALLNQLNGFLKTNDQSALRMYIRRANAIVGLKGDVPDGKPKEVVQAAIEQGGVIGFKNKAYVALRGHTTAEAKALVKFAEERFINPDGKRDFGVFDRNVLSEIAVLNDAEFLGRLAKMAKEIDAGNTDRREIHVSEKTAKFIRSIGNQAETMLHQIQAMSDDRKAPKERKAKASKPRASNKAVTAAKAVGAATAPAETVN